MMIKLIEKIPFLKVKKIDSRKHLASKLSNFTNDVHITANSIHSPLKR